jgi:ABC-type multidrug transport system ATPase subunit
LQPRLLILDEPTEGMQPNIVSEIGDVIIRMDKGRIVATGTMDALTEAMLIPPSARMRP